ncbi:hypothetical protein VPH35_081558 [Triticum aestivum]
MGGETRGGSPWSGCCAKRRAQQHDVTPGLVDGGSAAVVRWAAQWWRARLGCQGWRGRGEIWSRVARAAGLCPYHGHGGWWCDVAATGKPESRGYNGWTTAGNAVALLGELPSPLAAVFGVSSCRWVGVLVASRGAAVTAEVGRQRRCPVGRQAGGMGGALAQGCATLNASAPPPLFPDRMWADAAPALFEAGCMLRSLRSGGSFGPKPVTLVSFGGVWMQG